MKFEFSRQISEKKKAEICSFIKIRSVGVELFHVGEPTDRHDESDSRFSQFCERAKDCTCFG